MATFTAFSDLALAMSRFITVPGKITTPRKGSSGKI